MKVRVLIVEDSEMDAELLVRAVARAGVAIEYRRVDDLSTLAATLRSSPWDIVLSDFNLPGFDAFDVLAALADHVPAIPLVVVSGAIGEETAVNLMKAGARDFVRKDGAGRLGPVIYREIKEAAERRARTQAEEQLRRTREITNRILDSSEDCIAVLTLDADFISVNREGGTLPRSRRGRPFAGTSWFGLWIEEATLARARTAVADAGRGGVGRFQGVSGTAPEREDWDVMVSPILDAGGRPERLLAVARDITASQRAERELRRSSLDLERALERANSASEIKSMFLANVSHEIRTPLGAIVGFAELLKEESLGAAERRGHLETIERNGQLLGRLIDDLLDLQKIEAGKLDFENVEFDVVELIEDVVRALHLKAAGARIEVDVDTRLSAAERVVRSDPTRVKQILMNVVGNAIKFTPAGRVVVRSRRTGPDLSIEIVDTGIGLSPDQTRRLFHYFSQADGSVTRRFGGSGLGLALSRELARHLGGELRLEASELGRGSTFAITLPHRPAGGPAAVGVALVPAAEPSAAMPPVDLHGLRILLVEDSPDNQTFFTHVLGRAGATVECAADGVAGVERALANAYDLVLMDIQMPELDGFSALRRLRAAAYDRPVIALTAHAMRSDRLRSLEAGFSEHLTKPIDARRLIHACSLFKASK